MGLEAFVCRFVKTSVFMTFLASADSTRTHKEKMCYYSHTRGGGGGGESGVGFVLWHWSSSTSTEQLHSSCSSWKVTALLKGNLAAVAVGRQINPYSSFPRRFSKHDLALPVSQHPLNHGARPKKMAYRFPPLSFESHVPLPALDRILPEISLLRLRSVSLSP